MSESSEDETKNVKKKPKEVSQSSSKSRSPNKRSSFKKSVGIIVIIAIIVLASVGAYLFFSQADTKDSDPDLNFEWVKINPGSFMMGNYNSGPEAVHQVTIAYTFYMLKFEVTQRQWKAVMGNNPSLFTGNENNPIECVSWTNVQDFINQLNQLDPGHSYRLPSEAEWEYCCRAGSTTDYCFGDDPGQLSDYAWYTGNSNEETQVVGQKLPNAWGLYDMHGNVAEWCQDNWHNSYTGAPDDGSAWESDSGSYDFDRVDRGGSWDHDNRHCRSWFRSYVDGSSCYNLGFRLVKTI